jgi:hypothetical protein
MTSTDESGDLWQEFHDLVNMTSRELREWLATDASGPRSDALPDQAGSDLSRAVLEILGKRRTDLTPADAEAMQRVVDRITEIRGSAEEPTAGDTEWRHRLMSLGHDPLKDPDA